MEEADDAAREQASGNDPHSQCGRRAWAVCGMRRGCGEGAGYYGVMMAEKVTIGNCELWLGDCMDYMATLQDKAFDLAIVDPPYGIGHFTQADRVSKYGN